MTIEDSKTSQDVGKAPVNRGRRIGLLPKLTLSRRGRRLLPLVCVIGGGAALGLWQFERLGHVTETDARVMADVVTISSRADGWVVRRAVTDGDRVLAGAELVVIDQREVGLQLAALRAKAASISLERDRTATQLHMTETTAPSAVALARARRDAAAANVRVASSEVERTQRDYRRTDALVTNQFSSRQTWDFQRSQMDQAVDRQAAAKAQLAEAEAAVADATARTADVEMLRQQWEALGHDAEQVEAQIHEKDVALSDRVVRSPIDGIVDRKFVEPGEYVIPGQRLLLVHDPKAVWIEANVKETKLASLKPGQPVVVSVDAYPGVDFAGRVERIGNAATSAFALLPSPNPSGNFTKITQRVPVRIAVNQREETPLRPGMMVEVDIDAGHP
jgi:membrane fusion protein (multidrug efflux system)